MSRHYNHFYMYPHYSDIFGNTAHKSRYKVGWTRLHYNFLKYIVLFVVQVIPALGNTSFNVVFLGREEGEVESNLFIHTSEGSFKYQVSVLVSINHNKDNEYK